MHPLTRQDHKKGIPRQNQSSSAATKLQDVQDAQHVRRKGMYRLSSKALTEDFSIFMDFKVGNSVVVAASRGRRAKGSSPYFCQLTFRQKWPAK